jgi:hypothetical protein
MFLDILLDSPLYFGFLHRVIPRIHSKTILDYTLYYLSFDCHLDPGSHI